MNIDMHWTTYEFNPTFDAYPLGPECPDACPDGWASHVWKVGIEEHQVTLFTDECAVCSRGITNGALDDCLEMSPIEATLEFGSDCGNLGGWHGTDRCDCGWWWVLTPTRMGYTW